MVGQLFCMFPVTQAIRETQPRRIWSDAGLTLYFELGVIGFLLLRRVKLNRSGHTHRFFDLLLLLNTVMYSSSLID